MKVINRTHRPKRMLVIVVVAAVVGGLAAFGAYYFVQYRTIARNPNAVTQKETQAVVDAVAKRLVLPKDETPTLATIEDTKKLKDQPFFTDAVNGDKILIYTKAKKAIVYRPSEDKIINVGPILLDQTAKAKVEVLDGRKDQADSNQAAQTLASQFVNDLTVIKQATASQKNYLKTKVIDVKGTFGNLTNSIAGKLGGEVSSLPKGETPDKSADIVVIIAQ